jgi:DNA-directed DNA polymerase
LLQKKYISVTVTEEKEGIKMNKKVNNWFTELEKVMPELKSEPGYCKYHPNYLIKLVEWIERFQTLTEENKKLHNDKPKFVVFDLETTGLHTPEQFRDGEGGVTDVAGAIILGSQYLGNPILKDGTQIEGENKYEFNSLANPGVPIPDEVVELTGITNAMRVRSRHQKNVLADFREFASDAILVGHNIGDSQFNKNGFDIARVYGPISEGLFEDDTQAILENALDTLPFFRYLVASGSHTNEELGAKLGVKLVGAHRAMPDVRVNALAFSKLLPVLFDTPLEELKEYAHQMEEEKGKHILSYVRPGAEANETGELDRWLEFGIRVDEDKLKLKRNKKILTVRFQDGEFLFDEVDSKSGTVSAEEVSHLFEPDLLKLQALVLTKENHFEDLVKHLEDITF